MRTWLSVILAAAFGVVALPAFGQDVTPGAAPAAVATPTCAADDPVVWVNKRSKKYHLPGDKVYGKTKRGRYMCKSSADASGYKLAHSHSSSGSAPPPNASGAAPHPEATDDSGDDDD